MRRWPRWNWEGEKKRRKELTEILPAITQVTFTNASVTSQTNGVATAIRESEERCTKISRVGGLTSTQAEFSGISLALQSFSFRESQEKNNQLEKQTIFCDNQEAINLTCEPPWPDSLQHLSTQARQITDTVQPPTSINYLWIWNDTAEKLAIRAQELARETTEDHDVVTIEMLTTTAAVAKRPAGEAMTATSPHL